MTRRLRPYFVPLFAGTVFILLSALFVGYPGVQNDEAIFASPLFGMARYSWRIANHTIPIMVMSYLGALKAWLYAPVFALAGASALSLRIPVILIGTVGVVLFHECLTLMYSRRAAAFGTLLLATDPVYVLTNCFDWGPVALQHLFLIASIFAGLKYRERHLGRWLFVLFLMFGLGVWDKHCSFGCS